MQEGREGNGNTVGRIVSKPPVELQLQALVCGVWGGGSRGRTQSIHDNEGIDEITVHSLSRARLQHRPVRRRGT